MFFNICIVLYTLVEHLLEQYLYWQNKIYFFLVEMY